jgi:acetyl-CoA carboxylase biotin carboxyl carrier protein
VLTRNLMSAENDRFGLDDVRALAQVMKDFDLGALELRRASGERLHLTRAAAQGGAAPGGAALLHVGMPAASGSPSVLGGAGGASGQSSAQAGAAGGTGQGAVANPMMVIVNAPLVGTFYRSANPDSPPFVEVGQRVRRGQTLCIIEAMKLMNELESEVDGVVAACLADNGRPVEYGQPLFQIERTAQKA